MVRKFKWMKNDSFHVLLLFFSSMLLFTWGIRSQEVIGFESRFYLFAQEMWQNGISWFPTTYQKAYPDYPVTSTLLIYFSAKLMGELNKFAAVLPTAIAAALTVVMTYLIGAKESKTWGWYGVCCLLLTFTFVKAARSINLDIYPTLITTACFYIIFTKDEILFLPWKRIVFLFLLGFAFRGPIGLIMPAGVVCAYYFFSKKWRYFFLIGSLALFILSISSFLLMLLAYHEGGDRFVFDVLRMEVLGRINHHSSPFYFYWTTGLKDYLLALPATYCFIMGLLYLKFIKNNNEYPLLIINLIVWLLVILIGMSIPGDKKIRYILPMIPAASLLAAYIFIMDSKIKYFLLLRFLLQTLLFILPIILIITLLLLAYFKANIITYMPISFGIILLFLLICQLAGVFLYFYYPVLRTPVAFFVAIMSFFLINFTMIEPIELAYEKAHDFVVQLEKKRLQAHLPLVFYKEKSDGIVIKYLINMPLRNKPIFIEQEAHLKQFMQPAFFITSARDFKHLPKELVTEFQIIAEEKLGHVPMVVFKRKRYE